MKKQKNKLILWISTILFIVVLIGFSITIKIYSPYWFGLEKRTFYASVNVTLDSGGFDLNTTALTFGKISLGGSASRGIIFDNKYEFPVIARVSSRGRISEILTYENDILIEKNETRKLSFSVATSNKTELGFYEGYITVKVVPIP